MGDKVIFEEVERKVDNKTGEIITDTHRTVKKVEKTPDFVMLFTEGVGYLVNARLTKQEMAVLMMYLSRYVSHYENTLLIDKGTKEVVAEELGTTINFVNKTISKLYKSGIIIKDKHYKLNPYIFGKGNWNEIRRLRQEIVVDWDFENNTSIKSIRAAGVYGDVPKEPVVVEAKQDFDDKNNVLRQEVLIDENKKTIEKDRKKSDAIERLKQLAKKHLVRNEALHLQKSSDLRKFRTEAIEAKVAKNENRN